jgi:hypothetical protein
MVTVEIKQYNESTFHPRFPAAKITLKSQVKNTRWIYNLKNELRVKNMEGI